MNHLSAGSRPAPAAMPVRPRLLWVLTVAWGAGLIWLSHRPPMIDLPQHAGQIALLLAWLDGSSPWNDLLVVNVATPYLTMYGLTTLLATALPVQVATKVVMTLAYLGFVVLCVRLRTEFEGDPRLDWLIPVSYFGFAWKWGFLTFLVALPVGLAFIWASVRHIRHPTPRSTLTCVLLGLLLMVSHGLVFGYAWLTVAAILVVSARSHRWRLAASAPLLFSGVACLVFLVVIQRSQSALGIEIHLAGELAWTPRRLGQLFSYSYDSDMSWWQAGAAGATLAGLVVMRARFSRQDLRPLAPLAMVLALFFLAPSTAMNTAYLYERFAALFLPVSSFALACAPNGPSAASYRALGPALLMLGCWIPLAVHSVQAHAFRAESAGFEKVLSVLEPGRRMLYLPLDKNSTAVPNGAVYVHFGAWYQADKAGFVDSSFAWFPPQVMRFRRDALPAVDFHFPWHPRRFTWSGHDGDLYDYFLIRSNSPVRPSQLFEGARCQPDLLVVDGVWQVYRRGSCTAQGRAAQADAPGPA